MKQMSEELGHVAEFVRLEAVNGGVLLAKHGLEWRDVLPVQHAETLQELVIMFLNNFIVLGCIIKTTEFHNYIRDFFYFEKKKTHKGCNFIL